MYSRYQMFIIDGPTQVAQPQRAVYLECKREIRDAIIDGPTQVAQPQRAVYLECKGEIRDAISLVRNLGGPVGVLAAIAEYSSQNGFPRVDMLTQINSLPIRVLAVIAKYIRLACSHGLLKASISPTLLPPTQGQTQSGGPPSEIPAPPESPSGTRSRLRAMASHAGMSP